MKILQIMAGNRHGGAETAFVDMCVAMHQAGVDVEVVTRSNALRLKNLRASGLKVHTLPFGSAVDIYTPYKIKKIIKKVQPDIVQTWMARAAKKTPNWEKLKTEKKFFTIARLGGYYKLKNYNTTDYFIPITPDIKSYLKNNGIAENRIKHINNFAETERDSLPVNREMLDTPSNATVIVCLSRLHQNKALDVVIEGLKELPEAYLWLAGEGPLQAQLEGHARKCGVDKRVKFLGWRNDRAALLKASDICAFISRVEPFGTVFVQSWANKTPVIVSDAAGPAQYCRDGEDCLMVPIDNVAAFVDAVKKIETDKVLRMKLVQNGYQRYLNEFTKEKTLEEYLNFYQSLLTSA